MMKKITISTLTLIFLFVSNNFAAEEKIRVAVIPLLGDRTVVQEAQIPVSASGEWSNAGMSLPSMILHDLIFYVDSLGDQSNCRFSMGFAIDQFSSRTIRRFDLGLYESVELHFGAGVNTSDLRFGTISSGGSACIRNYAAFGFAMP